MILAQFGLCVLNDSIVQFGIPCFCTSTEVFFAAFWRKNAMLVYWKKIKP